MAADDLEGLEVFELWLGSGKGLRKERDEREEASEREGFEDTNIVRFEQDMVSGPCWSSAKRWLWRNGEEEEFVLEAFGLNLISIMYGCWFLSVNCIGDEERERMRGGGREGYRLFGLGFRIRI